MQMVSPQLQFKLLQNKYMSRMLYGHFTNLGPQKRLKPAHQKVQITVSTLRKRLMRNMKKIKDDSIGNEYL
jgi:hypothetical protein